MIQSWVRVQVTILAHHHKVKLEVLQKYKYNHSRLQQNDIILYFHPYYPFSPTKKTCLSLDMLFHSNFRVYRHTRYTRIPLIG